jgi:two-component system, OmpR family, phosphate regulon sensor histidine kinase PhoR
MHPDDKDTQLQLDTLRAVVDGMAEGVWITSQDGSVLRHNDALQEMLFTGTELVGRKPIELLPNAALAQAVTRACTEGQPTTLEVTIEGVRPRMLEVRVWPLGPELSGSSAVFHDVTELRRLEKIRTDFVANVSHELRTPITAIRGYAETLKSGALGNPGVAANMVDIIHRQSERLSELVEDLLELSRIEARQIQLAKKPVGVKASVQRAADAVAPRATAKGVKVSLDVPDGLFAEADERALEQVLVNLLDNAVKYTPAGGAVTVKARRENQASVELEVKDTGMGIEAKHLPRIFERFYRVDKGRSREMGGTGLGLSIVKHLADAMGGDVRVESTHGVGSTFFVQLPWADGRNLPSASPSAPD